MKAAAEPFFSKDGNDYSLYTLDNGKITARITDYGGRVVQILVPDRDGKPTNVVFSYQDPADYTTDDKYLGASVGRCANRIRDARFTLNGTEYPLAANDGRNQNHSGPESFQVRKWTQVDEDRISQSSESGQKNGQPDHQLHDQNHDQHYDQNQDQNVLTLALTSPDGDNGFPGKLDVRTRFELTDSGLKITFTAVSDKDTICNMTNHCYFNLSGDFSTSVEDEYMQIHSDTLTPMDSVSIPTGEFRDVTGTPMDFRQPARIGDHIGDDYDQLIYGKGYDHNWVVSMDHHDPVEAARAWSDTSGIEMRVISTAPGIQLYTGNYLGCGSTASDGSTFTDRCAFALEAQYFPNAVNIPEFTTPLLKAGDTYNESIEYRFGIAE